MSWYPLKLFAFVPFPADTQVLPLGSLFWWWTIRMSNSLLATTTLKSSYPLGVMCGVCVIHSSGWGLSLKYFPLILKKLTVASQFWKARVTKSKALFYPVPLLVHQKKGEKVTAWDNLSLAINLNQEKNNFKLNSGTSFLLKHSFFLCMSH